MDNFDIDFVEAHKEIIYRALIDYVCYNNFNPDKEQIIEQLISIFE